MHVWVDIDNPPQVQYLLPLARAFELQGASVVITARDNGATLDLLEQRGVEFHPVGSSFGRRKMGKVLGSIRRGLRLSSFHRTHAQPKVLISSSRSSALAARRMRIPSFILCDYEYVDLRSYRMLGATIVFPDAIDASQFRRQGYLDERLMPFRGLKEDLSFAGTSLDQVQPLVFPQASAGLVRVLFRPPAEESHYYAHRSGTMTQGLLKHLASRDDAVVVFSPRYDWQIQQVMSFSWRNEPVVLTRPLPFIPLLTGCDLVISSGGTMLREAAYLGIPAYSVFGGRPGQVDLFLASVGRLRFVDETVGDIVFERRTSSEPLWTNRDLARDLAKSILERMTPGV